MVSTMSYFFKFYFLLSFTFFRSNLNKSLKKKGLALTNKTKKAVIKHYIKLIKCSNFFKKRN